LAGKKEPIKNPSREKATAENCQKSYTFGTPLHYQYPVRKGAVFFLVKGWMDRWKRNINDLRKTRRRRRS
jgi:hypothetical protein